MTRPASPPRVLLAILLIAFNLRIAVVAVGPLIERIRADTGMSSAVAGLLTAIPFLCMGVFAIAGIGLVRRLGFSRLLLVSLALIAGGTALRAAVADAALLVLATVPIGVGIALAGVALQGVVKRDFATRSGAVTGACVSALSLGAAIAAFTIVPAADALGGWQGAFALTALPAALAVVIWPWVGASLGDDSPEDVRRPARLPSRTAVALGVMFGCQGMCYAGMIAWVAAIFVDAGWTPATAAFATSSIPLLTIPASLVFSALSDNGDRRLWVAAMAVTLMAGLLGIAAAPTSAAWLWLGLVGIGVGAIFPLILALALDCADDPLAGLDLSAWMLAIGFSMSATAPVLMGALRDLSGGFKSGVGALAVLAAAAAVLAVTAFGRCDGRTAPWGYPTSITSR